MTSGSVTRKIFWHKFLNDSSYIREYLWKYRRLVGIGIISLLVVDSLEIILPLILKQTVDTVVTRKPRDWLLYLALAYFGTVFMQGICRYCWRMFLIRTAILSGRDIRGRYASHLFGLSASFFDKREVGQLISLATNDSQEIRRAIGFGTIVVFDAIFYFITIPVAMFILSPKLTLLAFAPLPIVPFLVIRNEREIHKRFEKVQESFSRLSAMAQENLMGIRLIKAFAREDAQIKRFFETGKEFIRLNLRLAKVQSSFGPTLDFMMSLGLVLLLFVGGKGVISDAVTLGTFIAFQRYIQQMIWPMAAIGLGVTYYQRGIASSGRIKSVISEKTDTPDPVHPVFPEDYSPARSWRTQGRIEFRNLCFTFPGAKEPAIQDFSFTIAPGERIALVGAIGCGKSALLSLIPRLYPVNRGMLFVDGVDINDWSLTALRNQVGYVGQDIFLFSESVAENIAIGLLDWKEEHEQIEEINAATKMAYVHDDILSLVHQYNTRLGERGVNLSGGQKQRLTIARALARKPSILVLDDALSSVDIETEEKILKTLRSRDERNTELIAAHRISTIQDADKIIVLEKGRIIQTGTHKQLIRARSGLYWKYHRQQQLKQELDSYVENIQV